MQILSTMDIESMRQRMFHYSLKDDDPLGRYDKILQDIEDSMDPTNRVGLDALPEREQLWLRST